MKYKLDIIIPVYNEGKNIILTLQSLYSDIKNDFNIYICYDFEEDDTLNAINSSIFRLELLVGVTSSVAVWCMVLVDLPLYPMWCIPKIYSRKP